MNRRELLLAVSVTALASLACGRESTDAGSPNGEKTAPGSPDSAPGDGGVEYEPAYPADVSSEGLSTGDVEQQEKQHNHGGGAHSHGEGEEHSHGDESHGHGDAVDSGDGEAR